MIRSYIVEYWAIHNGTLLGGVKRSQSSRFQREQDAINYLTVVRTNNGFENCDGRIKPSFLFPEIFVHCGSIPTAINCRCPRCHSILTANDARKAKAIPKENSHGSLGTRTTSQ